MARLNRIPKTIAGKIRDLDDHLYLLNEFRNGLMAGESAYIKVLSVELRTLVCRSSGTEGLLWRIVDELEISDEVQVHISGNVNKEHSSNKSLQLHYAPPSRAGATGADSSQSLVDIIKKSEVIYLKGTGYTHETLISHIAQQIGSAHEDEGADPHLVELIGTSLGESSALATILQIDSELILEVGSRTLDFAEKTSIYSRRPRLSRPGYSASSTEPKSDSKHFDSDVEEISNEGTYYFNFEHPVTNWCTDDNTYNLPRFEKGPLTVKATKHSDRTIEVTIAGIAKEPVNFRRPIPKKTKRNIRVVFAWSSAGIIVYMNGEKMLDTQN